MEILSGNRNLPLRPFNTSYDTEKKLPEELKKKKVLQPVPGVSLRETLCKCSSNKSRPPNKFKGETQLETNATLKKSYLFRAV